MKTVDEIRTQICKEIEGIMQGRASIPAIGGEQRIMQDIGLDSLDFATCLVRCEKWMGTKVRESGVDWSRIQTVDQLAEFLFSQQKAS